MKKKITIFCLIAFASLGFSQEKLNLGLYGGLPAGDNSDNYKLNAQANLDLVFHITQDIHLGITAGYSHFFGDTVDEVDVEDFVYIPFGGSSFFNLTEKFKIGADVGYGFVIKPDESDGGIYYAPKIGYSMSEKTDVVLAYRVISRNGQSITAVSLGIDFGIF